MRIFGKITWAIALPLLLSAMLCSCVKENLRPQDMPAEGESTVRLKFSSSDPEIVFTKATLNHKSENSIYNIFVFVFDGSGKRVYGHWFEEEDAVEDGLKDDGAYWHVNNSESEKTTGWIQFRCQNGTDMKIYLIANLDSDMVRISSDLLQYSILTEEDLLAAPVSLNQQVVSRNGYFLMTGMLEGVTIDGKDSGYYEITGGPLQLTRLDAKVRFKFVAGKRSDERGQMIKSFTPSQWKVVNVPAGSKLMDTGTDAVAVPSDAPTDDYPSYAGGFFDTPWINFEDFNTDGSTGFSFYMLENRQQPKRDFDSYNDRSRQLKDDSGMNRTVTVAYTGMDGSESSREMRLFENANDFSTYVVVTGQVVMDLNNDDQGQTLNADVQYIIHLGDWGADIASAPGHWSDDRYSNFTNFYTERNHSYTYTVTVNSVNNIRVEVESSQPGEEFKENQPGATGDVTVAKEEIAICDAHYESRTMTFHYRNFIQNGQVTVDDLTWRVSTPFSEGEPDRVNGQDVPTGLDYEWVHFRLNKKDDQGKYYSDKRRKFTPRVFARSETMRTADENKEGDGTPGTPHLPEQCQKKGKPKDAAFGKDFLRFQQFVDIVFAIDEFEFTKIVHGFHECLFFGVRVAFEIHLRKLTYMSVFQFFVPVPEIRSENIPDAETVPADLVGICRADSLERGTDFPFPHGRFVGGVEKPVGRKDEMGFLGYLYPFLDGYTRFCNVFAFLPESDWVEHYAVAYDIRRILAENP